MGSIANVHPLTVSGIFSGVTAAAGACHLHRDTAIRVNGRCIRYFHKGRSAASAAAYAGGDIGGRGVYSGFGFVGSPNRSVPGATGTGERSAEAMTTPRRGLVRLAPLFAAAPRMPGDIARGVRSLPADFRAFRRLHIYRIGSLCEPPPIPDAIIMTNALINSAPLVANIDDPAERDRLVRKVIYPISRALVGGKLSDRLRFPRERGAIFPLLAYRIDRRIRGLRARFGREGPQNFSTLLEASAYDDAGLSYRLPDHVHDERSGKW